MILYFALPRLICQVWLFLLVCLPVMLPFSVTANVFCYFMCLFRKLENTGALRKILKQEDSVREGKILENPVKNGRVDRSGPESNTVASWLQIVDKYIYLVIFLLGINLTFLQMLLKNRL